MDDQWPILESVVEYDTPWYTGGYDRVEQPDGTEKDYYWAALDPAVVVVPVTDDDEIVFVEQYRPTIHETFLELPAGIVDEHDGDPIDVVDPAAYETAARRELAEETGYDAGEVKFLQSYAASTGVLRHRRGIVVAHDLVPGEPTLDSNEFLSVSTVPIDEALDRARQPPANDSTIGALLLAKVDGYLE